MSTQQYPSIEPTREVRFAVVMYGGVSLAIYINGVAQELFHMVRSTAIDPATEAALLCDERNPGSGNDSARRLSSTERIYRKLSYLLSDEELLTNCRSSSEAEVSGLLETAVESNSRQISTRFIVDILSGTSAGGINAIHLSKALANDQPIDQLKNLWISEGDIDWLINDKKSVADLELDNQKPPLSLLNSRRMYLKLLKSLDDMEPAPQHRVSPYVDELDLYITTTDIEGVPLPLRLSDTVVYERRHKNVFHFKYATAAATGETTGEEWNHFTADYNPFLAFAARCTSSFPFAFEPMQLADINEILNTFRDYRDRPQCRADSQLWQPFFKENIDPRTGGPKVCFEKRSFGDGGYLDNKPFSYATELLARRHASVPVDRKLLYIEPSPEHPEDHPLSDEKPDALNNIKAALIDLPGYETIREDLQRVIQRNRTINRVNKIISRVEQDILEYEVKSQGKTRPGLHRNEWAKLDLAEMVATFGNYYLPYGRLRVVTATDDLTTLVAHVANFDEESSQFSALRCLIQAWRETRYAEYHEEGKATVNQFLLDYDFSYWLRRMNFLRKKVDELYRVYTTSKPALTSDELLIVERIETLNRKLSVTNLRESARNEILQELSFFKREFNEVYTSLRTAGRTIRSRKRDSSIGNNQPSFADKIFNLGINDAHLNYILGMPWVETDSAEQPAAAEKGYAKLREDECVARAATLLDASSETAAKLGLKDLKVNLDSAGDLLKALLATNAFDPARSRLVELLKSNGGIASDAAGEEVSTAVDHINTLREYLRTYYIHFDDYDQISFPILYGSDAGEADVVEIVRISPEDATSLIDERAEAKKADGRRKLAGTALHHFGAFLDRAWRENDIMWGRLDGAERLITTMLPDPEDKRIREMLIKEAHVGILKEELSLVNKEELSRQLVDSVVRVTAGLPVPQVVESVLSQATNEAPLKMRLQNLLIAALEGDELLRFMKHGYEVNRKLEPKPMLRVVSRATQVTGHIFENIADQNSLNGKNLAWIARLGKIFWGLVEIAVPHSLLNLLVFHWLRALYVFEVLLIVGSFLLGAPETQKFALTAFALTAAVNLTVLLLRDRMRLKNGWLYLFASVFLSLVLLLAMIGADDLFGLGFRDRLSERLHSAKVKLFGPT